MKLSPSILLLVFVLGGCRCYIERYSDLRGSYCAAREDPCCVGRRDACASPILGTLCYCDEFCNRTHNSDCCPDYPKVCLNIDPEPLRKCYINNQFFEDGSKLRVNCNDCVCMSMNEHMELMCEQDKCLIEPEVLERRGSWRPSNYSEFWGRKLSEGLRFRLGTIYSRRKVLAMTPIKQVIDRSKLPGSFDSRTKWPGLIGAPLDQSWCGSSWVFSTVGVASDRWSVLSAQGRRFNLSPQHLLSCNSKNQRGCDGGHLSRAWVFIKKFGLVSSECYPWTGDSSRCRLPKHRAALEARCLAEGREARTSLRRMGPPYRVVSEEGIMHEIMNSGPVQATMRVQPDFFSYGSGIYRCGPNPGSANTGFHSVRIIGWGVDSGTKYWLVANSWGEWWGESGYFRIRRGSNECNIEDFVIAAWTSTPSTRRPSQKDSFLGVVLNNSV